METDFGYTVTDTTSAAFLARLRKNVARGLSTPWAGLSAEDAADAEYLRTRGQVRFVVASGRTMVEPVEGGTVSK